MGPYKYMQIGVLLVSYCRIKSNEHKGMTICRRLSGLHVLASLTTLNKRLAGVTLEVKHDALYSTKSE